MLVRPPLLNIVILAAGRGDRLGACKPLARIRGESLLRRTVSLVTQLPGRCFVVTPPNAARFRQELKGLKVVLLENTGRAEGLASSVRLACERAGGAAGMLFLPVDLPDLRSAELRRLISIWCGARQRVVARKVNGHMAIPLILPKWLYPKTRDLKGDVGLKAVLKGLPPEALRLVELPSAARDVDTPAELAAARRFRAARA